MAELKLTNVDRVLSVYFQNNENQHAPGTVGVEVDLIEFNGDIYMDSSANRRFKVERYDMMKNECLVTPFEDQNGIPEYGDFQQCDDCEDLVQN